MKTDLASILNHTNFFKSNRLVDCIEKISKNKYKISSNNEDMVLCLLDLKEFEKIENEAHINEILEKSGLKPLKIYDMGLLPDIEKSYKIYQFREEISLKDFLSEASNEEVVKVAQDLARAIKKFHSISTESPTNWKEKFLIRLNQTFYRHGIGEVEDNDYILTDFIESNKHLTENTPACLLYKDISDKNIRVYDGDKVDLRAIKSLDYGDGTIDFVELNRIAIDNPEFSFEVIRSYFGKSRPSRKFLRLLALYQASLILESLVDLRESKEAYLTNYEIKKLFEMYDNFNSIYPSWIG